jgi:hypothetical protein
MNETSHEALELCRSLLAFSAPGMAVAVPHAALAQVVELASGPPRFDGVAEEPSAEALQELFDVAALALRYNRATTTVRKWFHDGLFGPPAERRFRGRGYVAPAAAVREFEIRTGIKSGKVEVEPEGVSSETASETAPPQPSPENAGVKLGRSARLRKSTPARAGGGFGSTIFAAQGGLRVRRPA